MSDGHEIFVTTFKPAEKAIGHFHILHGMAEHSGRYEEFARMICAGGYVVSLHDHRGHGNTVTQNDGLYGFFAEKDGFNRVVQDVYEVINTVRQQTEELPLTLFGHSMGSFLARRFTQLYSDQMHAAIYCGTGATTAHHVVGHQIAKVLSRLQGPKVQSLLMNSLSFGSFNKRISNVATAFDWICSDPLEVQKYIDDPQCGFISTNQFFVDLTGGLLQIAKPQEIAKIRQDLPILFMSGSDDPVGDFGKGVNRVAKELKKSGIENMCVYIFENMRHEILNEKNKQHVYDVVIRWLKTNEEN